MVRTTLPAAIRRLERTRRPAWRHSLKLRPAVAACVLALCVCAALVADAQAQLVMSHGPAYVNVRDAPYGAFGDGVRDDEAAFDAALASGKPVYVPAGTYRIASGRLILPDDTHVFGDGIGKTEVLASLTIGSLTVIGGGFETQGITFGAADRSHRFTTGARSTNIGWCRFRSPGADVLFDMADYTKRWSDPVLTDKCDVRDITWRDCEFEYTHPADPSSNDQALFNIWWDCRATPHKIGGRVSGLQWYDCVFNARDSSGAYGPSRVALLIQPSPPEHAADGPRPRGFPTAGDPDFDWRQVDHGAGLASGHLNPRRFRLERCYFEGVQDLASFDLCDNIRSWVICTQKDARGVPYWTYPSDWSSNGTQAQRDAAPAATTTQGWDIVDCWFADSYIAEIGRDVPADEAIIDHLGDGTRLDQDGRPIQEYGVFYNVPPAVLQHENELYGL